MRPRRSSSKNNSTAATMQKPTSSATSQWVFLLEESVILEDDNNDSKPAVCPLRHPKTGDKAMFMFAKNNRIVYEMIKFKEEFRSWAVDDHILQDGSLIITTQVDPLFLVLPYLMKAAKKQKYMTLDQIVIDEDYPECTRLQSCSGLDELHQITDTKGHDDTKAYKYNQDKTLSWLRLKVETLTDSLVENKMNLTNSTSSIFIKSNKTEKLDRDNYLRYSWGIISDYLSSELSETLREYLGISLPVSKPEIKTEEEPPAKRAKVEIAPIDDYTKSNVVKKTSKDVKMTQAQKKLSKTDKSGMKSLSHFFSAKSKT